MRCAVLTQKSTETGPSLRSDGENDGRLRGNAPVHRAPTADFGWAWPWPGSPERAHRQELDWPGPLVTQAAEPVSCPEVRGTPPEDHFFFVGAALIFSTAAVAALRMAGSRSPISLTRNGSVSGSASVPRKRSQRA